MWKQAGQRRRAAKLYTWSTFTVKTEPSLEPRVQELTRVVVPNHPLNPSIQNGKEAGRGRDLL